MKIHDELIELKLALGILQKADCNEEQNKEYRELLKEDKPLPDNVVRKDNGVVVVDALEFFTVKEPTLSKDELNEFLQYKQLESIITIKKCVVFFTVLTVISLVCGLILALSMFL